MSKTKKIINLVISFMVVFSFFGISKVQAAYPQPFDYELIKQSSYPSVMFPGETTTVWIEVKNTGTVTWNRDGIENVVRLGSGSQYGNQDQQRDYTSEFYDSSVVCEESDTDCTEYDSTWLSSNRPVAVMHPEVRPGWHTRFQFKLKAPTTPGDYKAYFTPVVEGVEWMKDIGIYWEIKVSNEDGIFCSQEMVECADGSFAPRDPDNDCIPKCDQSVGSNVSITSLTMTPAGHISITSGDVIDLDVTVNYSNGSEQDATEMVAWEVVSGTGSGTMHTEIPGRFIAGSIGDCRVRVDFNGRIVEKDITVLPIE